MTDTNLEAAAQVLRAAGYSVQEPAPPPPVNKCYWCGKLGRRADANVIVTICVQW